MDSHSSSPLHCHMVTFEDLGPRRATPQGFAANSPPPFTGAEFSGYRAYSRPPLMCLCGLSLWVCPLGCASFPWKMQAEVQRGGDKRPSQEEPTAVARPGVLALILGFCPLTSHHAWIAQGSEKAPFYLDFLLSGSHLTDVQKICLFLTWDPHLESFHAGCYL